MIWFVLFIRVHQAFLLASLVAHWLKKKKNRPVIQETQVQFLGWEDPLEKQMATHFQYSCLGNPMDRGAQWVTVHGVAKSQICLRNLTTTKTMKIKGML